MVPTIVFNEKMAVETLGQGDLGQPPFVIFFFVTKLVRGIDPDPANHANGDGETNFPGVQSSPVGDDVKASSKPGVLQGEVKVGDESVVAVGFKLQLFLREG